MADAYIYDAVRTPRGRGKKDGALHEVPSVRLASHVLEEVRDRNGLDTSTVDDIIFGCVDPVGEAGGVIPRGRGVRGRLRFWSPRHPDFALLRFGPRRGQSRRGEDCRRFGRHRRRAAASRA